MVNYIINPEDSQYTKDNGRFVSAIFIPKSWDISEFSHFGANSDNEEIDPFSYYKEFALDILKDLEENNEKSDSTNIPLIATSSQEWDYGDYVSDYDETLWTPDVAKEELISLNLQWPPKLNTKLTPLYNVDVASNYIMKIAFPGSKHICATNVRKALLKGGINLDDRPRKAGLYLAYFRRKKEWTEINPALVKKGDVCVTVNNADGHISLWTGKHWVSDFVLRGPHVYTYARDGVNTFYFRYTG